LRPRPKGLEAKAEAEAEARGYETEAEAKILASRPVWPRLMLYQMKAIAKDSFLYTNKYILRDTRHNFIPPLPAEHTFRQNLRNCNLNKY